MGYFKPTINKFALLNFFLNLKKILNLELINSQKLKCFIKIWLIFKTKTNICDSMDDCDLA